MLHIAEIYMLLIDENKNKYIYINKINMSKIMHKLRNENENWENLLNQCAKATLSFSSGFKV